MTRALIVVFLFFSLAPITASAWGRMGHRLVATLAWDGLTPATRVAIETLLAGEPEPALAGIANWADDLREDDPDLGKRTGKWHYVNLAEDGCVYVRSRHCRNGDCVVEAIGMQTAILADTRRPKSERLQALKFVVHFVGDIHQPLHAGYGRDKGGNAVQVNLDGRGSNLHSLWDNGILRNTGLDEPAYLQRLRAMPAATAPPGKPVPAQAAAWATASCAIVRRPGFYPARARIGADYLQAWRPVAEAQLRLAGAQLAATLNAALSQR